MPQNNFNTPPKPTNPSGDERSVGYEFELTGVDMDLASEIVQELYGGSIEQVSTYEYNVTGTRFGDFKLELDAQLLRDKKYEKLLKAVGVDPAKIENIDLIEGSLRDAASSVVPFEIITPPIQLSEMVELNRLVDALRKQKAEGTGSSFLYAFGLHINPEISDDSTQSLLNHMRAYVMLDPWIRKDAEINMSRRITPYINEYKEEYIQLILNPAYKPEVEELITDYFQYDNSRNRPLDMLPLFMYLNKELTVSLIEDTITSSRPTYHYRLPNCSLEDENWSIAKEWNRWVLVEKMAADPKTVDQYSRAWLKMKGDTLVGFEAKWTELINRWVMNND